MINEVKKRKEIVYFEYVVTIPNVSKKKVKLNTFLQRLQSIWNESIGLSKQRPKRLSLMIGDKTMQSLDSSCLPLTDLIRH